MSNCIRTDERPSMHIAIAVLAAGRASRFGGGKLDALCAGKPMGRWVLDAVMAAGLRPGVLIVAPDAPAFASEAMAAGWAIVTNPDAQDGLGGSVALAGRHADCLGADALLLLLADMPLIGADHIAALLSPLPITQPVATRYPGGRPGVPARLPASMLGALAALNGDVGAAALLRDRADLHLVDASAETITDVDDVDGLAHAELLLRAHRHKG